MFDPETHDCAVADLEYVWQRVESEELIAVLRTREMRNVEAYRSTICHACGKVWYVLDFELPGGDDDEDRPRLRRMVVAPKPRRLVIAENRAKMRSRKRAA